MARFWILVTLGVAVAIAGVAWYVAPDGKPRGYSGLEFARVTPAAASRAPMMTTRGALVYDVTPESPAARAGVKPGEVVAAIDGATISSAEQASGIVRGHRGGDRILLTLFDEVRGETRSRRVLLTIDAAPPVSKKLSVRPPRTLAQPYFYPPVMAANASWSKRIAKGAQIKPMPLPGLGAGRCNGFAPEGWRVRDVTPGTLRVVSEDGGDNALTKTIRLTPEQARDPRGFILGVVHAMFASPPAATPTDARPFGFSAMNFGTPSGFSGFALWRMDDGVMRLWLAGVPASDASWAAPLAGTVALSLRCESATAPRTLPRDPALHDTSVSTRCIRGGCEIGDYAGAYLDKLRLGYAHAPDGGVYLVNPRRDLWANGAEGPGFYHQIGGTDEKLEPGRTN